MFKVFQRQKILSWSADVVCTVADYMERSRYPLYTVANIQHSGSCMSAYLDCVMNTPSFLRYRKAVLGSSVDIKKHSQLLCPVPPLDTQRNIVEIMRGSSCDDLRNNMDARLASQAAQNEVARILGIEEVSRPRFGPLYILPRQSALSWSVHKTLSCNEYICRTPLYKLESILERGISHSPDNKVDYAIADVDNVLCIRPNCVGHGGLVESPMLAQREQIKMDGGQYIPRGSVLFYRIRPERMHYWINRGEFNLPVYAISKDFFLIRPNEDVMLLDFFDLLMHLPFIANQFKTKVYGHIPRISVMSMRAIMFPKPGLDVQKDLTHRFLRTIKSPDELMRDIKDQKQCAMAFVEKELFYGVK